MARAHVRIAAMLFALVASPAAAGARGPAVSCPADPALADLVAASDLIVVGRMEVPRGELAARARQELPDYLNIPVAVTSTIKGSPLERATLRFYPKDTSDNPFIATLLRLADMPSVLFLTQADDERPVGLYLAGRTPSALGPGSEGEVAAIRTELARQEAILREWRKDPSLPHYREVRDLLTRLGRVRGTAQQQMFNRLEALGPDAVPAIVAQMDDRRPLAQRSITLVNRSPDAFEAVRRYGPKLVVDALDAILNQIIGASFGSIVNGGSDRERAAAIAGWRVYAADLRCRRSPRTGG